MSVATQHAVAVLPDARAAGSPIPGGPTLTVSTAVPINPAVVSLVLERCLAEIIGQDTVALLGVRSNTRLLTDLGLDSIEFIHLIELVQQHYRPEVAQFMDRLQGLSLRKIAALTVGDLVESIVNASH
jgi:acyl carrier protein